MKKLSLLILLALTAGCSIYKPSTSVDDITKKALSFHDRTICQSLSRADAKNYCVATVDGSSAIDEAIGKNDIAKCDTIEDVEYKKACQLAVTTEQRRAEREKQQIDQLDALQNGDSIDACKQLEAKWMNDQCIMNVALRMAHNKKDPKVCDQIASTGVRQVCKEQAK